MYYIVQVMLHFCKTFSEELIQIFVCKQIKIKTVNIILKGIIHLIGNHAKNMFAFFYKETLKYHKGICYTVFVNMVSRL